MTTASWHFWYGLLLDYVEEFGHARVPNNGEKYKDFNLGQWVSDQRKLKLNNKLFLDRIKRLDLLSQWSWDALEAKWNEGFGYLKKYVGEYNHAKVPNGLKYQNFNLGQWVATQRKNKDKIDSDRIKKIESLPGWVWRVKSE